MINLDHITKVVEIISDQSRDIIGRVISNLDFISSTVYIVLC